MFFHSCLSLKKTLTKKSNIFFSWSLHNKVATVSSRKNMKKKFFFYEKEKERYCILIFNFPPMPNEESVETWVITFFNQFNSNSSSYERKEKETRRKNKAKQKTTTTKTLEAWVPLHCLSTPFFCCKTISNLFHSILLLLLTM